MSSAWTRKLFRIKTQARPPEWCRGLRHCIVVLEASLLTGIQSRAVSQPAITGRPMRCRTIGPASPSLGEGLARQDVLIPSRSSDSCGRPGACMLTQCFLGHISVAGFRVKQAVSQEVVRLGRVMFLRTHDSRPFLPSARMWPWI